MEKTQAYNLSLVASTHDLMVTVASARRASVPYRGPGKDQRKLQQLTLWPGSLFDSLFGVSVAQFSESLGPASCTRHRLTEVVAAVRARSA
eukprot:scaffold61982_cov106-Phaeocystis_antarctica.AAC.2